MVNIFVFTQNVCLESLKQYQYLSGEQNVFITTHMLFVNEKGYLETVFGECTFLKFADFLSDEEMESCDVTAYLEENKNEGNYYNIIKRKKNKIIVSKVIARFGEFHGYIFSNDLGIDEKVWIDVGFRRLICEYYYSVPKREKETIPKKTDFSQVRSVRFNEVYAAEWKGKKYIFIGNLNRIRYRLELELKESEYERELLNQGMFYPKEECQYLTTIHEYGKCKIPDKQIYDVRCIQDGYLPPNYSSLYLKFYPSNFQFYAWDIMGEGIFKNQNIPVSLIPFRKKIYMPIPIFRKKIKTVLIATSGSGDWTAVKNRSDDDLMVEAFVKLAQKFPDIEFIYRCHHTWVHPQHVGINSINRVIEYFHYTGLKNIHISSNIFEQNLKSFKLSIPRSSLDEDLQKADFVFGEHSISMIDAAFKGIPFASINLTNRRNFFGVISEMGFPACETVEDIENIICNAGKAEFQKKYIEAVKQYNKMTDAEEDISK